MSHGLRLAEGLPSSWGSSIEEGFPTLRNEYLTHSLDVGQAYHEKAKRSSQTVCLPKMPTSHGRDGDEQGAPAKTQGSTRVCRQI